MTYFVLGHLLKSAELGGLLARSPAVKVRLPQARRIEQRFLTIAEVERLSKAIHPRYKRLRTHAVVMTSVFRRITPLFRALQGAASSESAAAAIVAEFDARRLDAAGHYASAAAATGKLAISEEECRDVLAATLDGALWHRLVEERGWTDERFAGFLGSMWIATLVQ